MSNPIWKDYFIDLGSAASAQFRIRIGSYNGTTIYSGLAFKRPGQTNNKIKINDICADYLQNVLPSLSHAEFSALQFPLTFYIQKNTSGSTWTNVEAVSFLNDWSYDYDYDPETMGMAFPINGRTDRRQPLLFTAYESSEITATLNYADGTSSFIIIPIELTDDFDASFNEDFSRMLRAAGSGTAVLDLSSRENLVSVEINGQTYEIMDSCSRYALYYVNAYGGWDSLLIEGNTKESDSLKRQLRSIEYDNTNITNRGTENYLTEIEKKFSMNTAWLTDDQSLRMHHLLNSTCVYLFDMMRQQMIPVVLTNSSTEYKTYRNNGKQLISYTIEMTIAQNRIRR